MTKRQEGYLLVDNRFGPGVTEEMVKKSGLAGVPIVKEGQVLESATITCSHCQSIVIINQHRTRERTYCRRCNHYICDGCSLVMSKTLECLPMKKILDEQQERAFKSSLILNEKGV